jgi:hypothetical protein
MSRAPGGRYSWIVLWATIAGLGFGLLAWVVNFIGIADNWGRGYIGLLGPEFSVVVSFVVLVGGGLLLGVVAGLVIGAAKALSRSSTVGARAARWSSSGSTSARSSAPGIPDPDDVVRARPWLVSVDAYLEKAPGAKRENVESISRRGQTEIDRMAEGVREAPLVDAAFEYLMFRSDRHHSWDAPGVTRPHLQDLIRAVDKDALIDATERARRLIEDAYRYGDAALQRGEDAEGTAKVLERMRQDHPGFAESSYSRTLMWGCFLAR